MWKCSGPAASEPHFGKAHTCLSSGTGLAASASSAAARAGIAAVPTRAAPRGPTPSLRSGSAHAGQVGKVVAAPGPSVHPASPRPAPSPRAPGPQSPRLPAAHLRRGSPRPPAHSRLENLGPSWDEGVDLGSVAGCPPPRAAALEENAAGRGPGASRPGQSLPSADTSGRRGGGNFLPSRHAGCQVQPPPLGLLLAAAPGPAPRSPLLARRSACSLPRPAAPGRARRPRHSPPARPRAPSPRPLGGRSGD